MVVMVVAREHGASLDYTEGTEIPRQHYAFLVSEQDFDAVYGKIHLALLAHWADPRQSRPGKINHSGDFLDLSGHAMEIPTRPYGSGGG